LDYDSDIPVIPSELSSKNVDINDIIKFFKEYLSNDVIGVICHRHLAIADQSKQLANDKTCIKLAKLQSRAVDFQKSGKPVTFEEIPFVPNLYYPDYMEKPDKQIYQSTSVLGKIIP
jgi:RNA-dependent RNA polymerase